MDKMEEVKASIPEPSPINKGVNVNEALKEYIKQLYEETPYFKQKIIHLLEERNLYGLEKYGQSLMSKDGRDDIEDARQEIGDMIQYIFKAKINSKDTSELIPLVKFTLDLLNLPVFTIKKNKFL